ncbi:AAA family ATPase [Enterocloster bolteae]|uniref:cytidylate kinase-like family protein n=1 Tax=Enterocloster bolteae TaxID=208479 RepID=UPI002108898E|nr:cytidylate kinase-like family protein [Enterocloster bolteae]MCQ5144442.1 cytidylate kinase-like family protein [Enterocloster bolteae]
MRKRIITISREFGSGGHTIGKMVAEKLGIPFYDQELVEKVMASTGFDREFIHDAGEYASTVHGLVFGMARAPVFAGYGTMSYYDQIYVAQSRIIQELAEQEACVIVGRCSDYILHERNDCIHVFVHADKESRAERVRNSYGNYEENDIQERLEEKDRKRSIYYKQFTNCEWGRADHYHLTLDSGLIGLERCADWITCLAQNE